MTPPAVRLVLLRHGETEWSSSGRHTSITDIDLTERGARQAVALPGTLGRLGISPVAVLCSPRLRAERTAELAGLEVTQICDELAEWAYGEYEGITSVEIHRSRPGWSIFADGAPGGESPSQVAARADAMIVHAMAAGTAAGGGDVVLVGHGHFSRVLAARWIAQPVGLGAALTVDPASISVLGHYHGDPALSHLNVPTVVADAANREVLVTGVENDVVTFSRRSRTGQARLAHQASTEISLAAYRILVQVSAEKECRITDLAVGFEVGKPTMSRQVATLEDLALVTRRPDPVDGRGVLVSLSPAGRRLLARARKVRHQWIDTLLLGFDDAEAAEFAVLFHRFVTRPSAYSDND